MISALMAALLAITPLAPGTGTIYETIPDQYKGPAAVYTFYLEPIDVQIICSGGAKNVNPNKYIFGCFRPEEGILVTINPCDYPEADTVGTYAHLSCHEKAHVNGWVHKVPKTKASP
jgi:hypothetical protein